MERNNMQYGHSSFDLSRQGFFESKSGLDCTNETTVKRFIIGGSEPEGTLRRLIFRIEDRLYKFSDAGHLIEYAYRGEFEDVIKHGNTVGELLALADVNDFCGKKVYPVIALAASVGAAVKPKIKLAVEVESYNDIYTRYYYSPVYDLTENAKIYALSEVDKFCNGHATSLTECRILKKTGWSDWQELAAAINSVGSKIQFRSCPVLTTLDGSDSVNIGAVVCEYTTDGDISAADSYEIITAPQSYDGDLKSFYALLKHDELIDAQIKAYVNLSGVDKRRENLRLGTGTGSEQTLILLDRNIAQDTINVTIDGVSVSEYHFDTLSSTITLTAESGCEICASYQYDFDGEDWREMAADISEKNKTRFTYSTNEVGKRIVSYRFKISRQKGTVDSQYLGAGDGRYKSYSLDHAATEIICGGFYEYDEAAQILKAAAPLDSDIIVSYNWRGVQPAIHGYICGAAV